MFTDIHHVGYLVENLDETIAAYERIFGAVLVSRAYSPPTRSTNAFVRMGDTLVELMEPEDKGVLGGAKAQILHHVAYQVPDLAQAVRELEEKGVEILDKTPRVNALGWKIVYFNGGERLGAGQHLIQV